MERGILVWTLLHFFVMLHSSEAQALITTQPYDNTQFTGGGVVFTCEVDKNGSSNIGTDDVRWEMLRSGRSSFTTVSGLQTISITTTISGDILTSTLTINNVTTTFNGLYRCVVPASDVVSRNASLRVAAGPPGPPMNIRVRDITNTSFVVQWDEVDDADQYYVNWRSDDGVGRRAITSRTSRTVRGLTPNTTYHVTITPYNDCFKFGNSSVLTVTTNVVLLVRPSTPPSSSSSLPLSPSPPSSSSPVFITTSIATSITPTAGSSSHSSDSPRVPLAVIFPVIAVITTLGVIILIAVIITVKKTKANSSINTAPEAYEATLTRKGFKNPLYSTSHKISHDKHPITPTDSGLYETLRPSSRITEDVKLQPNPAYGTSDKVLLDKNPAYGVFK